MAFTVTGHESVIQKYVNAFSEPELEKGIGNSYKIRGEKERTKDG